MIGLKSNRASSLKNESSLFLLLLLLIIIILLLFPLVLCLLNANAGGRY